NRPHGSFQAGRDPGEDRRGPAEEVVSRGVPPRAALPGRGAHGPRPGDGEDRGDRREHPGPPLRPLRPRGGPVTSGDGAKPRYGRILLKLSGEALLGDRSYGVDPAVCAFIARQIATVHATGVQVGIVVGGGNIFRGL